MDCWSIKLVLYRHITHLVSSSKDHSVQFQILYRLLVQDTALLHQFLSDTPLPFLRYNQFPISFCTPVLASPDNAPTPNAGKTVPVRNGINPANAGKNPPSIFMLYANCVFYIFIVMPYFTSYASTSLSSCELVIAITSRPCRSENVRQIVIDLQLDSNAFLSLSF